MIDGGALAEGIGLLAIGHVTRDIHPSGARLGGTAAYAALAARSLGEEVAVVTSMGPDASVDGLGEIPVHVVPAVATTTFENVQTPEGRRQRLHGLAAPLGDAAVPLAWRRPRVVLLGPVADEVDPGLAASFADAFVGLTPQGWMRQWDEEGTITVREWTPSEALSRRADAAVISLEDVGGDEAAAARFASRFDVAVVTEGELGARLCVGSAPPHHVPSPPVEAVDGTGAGDIFAAVFFVRLALGGTALDAAREATALATGSVRRVGLSSALLPALAPTRDQ